MMISSEYTGKVTIEDNFLCAVCRKDVVSNAILNNYITYLLTANFAAVECIGDVVVLEAERR